MRQRRSRCVECMKGLNCGMGLCLECWGKTLGAEVMRSARGMFVQQEVRALKGCGAMVVPAVVPAVIAERIIRQRRSVPAASGGKNYTSAAGGYQGQRVRRGTDCDPKRGDAAPGQPLRRRAVNLKPKDLIGMPWRLAFALQADGWWLRQDIIWSKPNPMPGSQRDRCTTAHEYIFLLTKSARYFFDLEEMKEPSSGGAHSRGHGVNPARLRAR